MEINCEYCMRPSDKTLSCFHSFCNICLGNPCDGSEVLHECLACGLTTRVESNGIQSLQVEQHKICRDHGHKQLSMHCETCQKLICVECTTSSHRGHQYSHCRRVLPDYKAEVKKTMERICKNIVAVSQVASQQKSLFDESDNNIKVAQNCISTTMEVLHSILEVRKDALTCQLQDTGEGIMQDLKISHKNLSRLLGQLNVYLSCVEKNFTICSEVELLSMKKSIEKYSNHLQKAYETLMKDRVTENDFFVQAVFQPSNISEILSAFGRVEVTDVNSEDMYEIKPWFSEPTLSLKLSVERQSCPLYALTNLKSPTGVAISQRGEIVVAESRGDQISVFSPISGEKIHCFGSCGSDRGKLRFPCSIAIDDRGNILVVDGCNNRVQKYSSSGKFLTEAGCRGSGQLQFREPEGIAINPVNKKIYIADNNSHRIQVLNEDLSFDFSFGSKGLHGGHLYYPWGIACGNNGDVYVTSSGSCYVKVFTSSGQFLREFGSEGDIEGCLKWPTGICLAQNGAVYVSEYGNHRVSVFTTGGIFMQCFGSRGTSCDEFGNVRGLAIDTNGVLYICDTDNNRVVLY